MQDFKSAKRCIKRAIHSYKNDNLEKLEVMVYFQAMCYKNLRKYDKARRDYGSLLAMYNKSEHAKIL
jgi:tetratricopeptide (TPR) repeat protein